MGQEASTMPERRQHAGAGTAGALLRIVCAWCQQHIGWHQAQTPMPFQISYSICARCYAAVAREFDPLTAGAV